MCELKSIKITQLNCEYYYGKELLPLNYGLICAWPVLWPTLFELQDLFAPCAFSYTAMVIAHKEDLGQGITVRNLAALSISDELVFHLLMMFADGVLYFLLGAYIGSICPGTDHYSKSHDSLSFAVVSPSFCRHHLHLVMARKT